MSRVYGVVALLALFALFAACGTTSGSVNPKLVVATIQPYGFLAGEIAGKRLTVEVLIPSSASPHTWSPRPVDVERLSRAAIIVANGLGLETRLGSIFLKQKAKTVFAAALVAGHANEGDGHDASQEDSDGDAHGHDGADPHLWTDPVLMVRFAGMLADRFAALDPAGRDVYRANFLGFSNRMHVLDRDLERESRRYRTRAVVTFHDAFARFCARYGVARVAVLLASPGREPSVGELVGIGKKIRDRKVKALYTEPQLDGKSARVLAGEYGLPVYVLDPLGMTESVTNYESLIRYNWSQLVRGFVE